VHTGIQWRDHLKNQSIDGRIILRLIFNKQDGRARTGLMGFRIGTNIGGVSCECSDDPLSSIQCKEYLNEPSFQEVSAPQS